VEKWFTAIEPHELDPGTPRVDKQTFDLMQRELLADHEIPSIATADAAEIAMRRDRNREPARSRLKHAWHCSGQGVLDKPRRKLCLGKDALHARA